MKEAGKWRALSCGGRLNEKRSTRGEADRSSSVVKCRKRKYFRELSHAVLPNTCAVAAAPRVSAAASVLSHDITCVFMFIYVCCTKPRT